MEIASAGLTRKSQWPRSPEVDTPHRRSAPLIVRANDALLWGAARKPTSTIAPRSDERKHVCSAQFISAHRWRIGTSWSRSCTVARKALDTAVDADICLTERTSSSTPRRCATTASTPDAASRHGDIAAPGRTYTHTRGARIRLRRRPASARIAEFATLDVFQRAIRGKEGPRA